MKKYLFLLFLSLPLCTNSQTAKTIPNSNIIIRFQPKVKAESFFKRFLKSYRNSEIQITINRKVSTIFNIYSIQSNSPQTVIQQLKQHPEVLKVEYDTPLNYRNTTPNDIDFPQQWNILNTQVTMTNNVLINGENDVLPSLD